MLSEPATSSSTLAISHGNNEQNDHASNPSYLSQSGASTSGLRHEYSTPNIAPRYHATNSLHPVDLITEPTSALATATSSQDPGEWDWKSIFTSNRGYAFTTPVSSSFLRHRASRNLTVFNVVTTGSRVTHVARGHSLRSAL